MWSPSLPRKAQAVMPDLDASAKSPTYSSLLYSVEDHVATITLHRPARRNAWTLTLAVELSKALGECQRDDNVRVVIVTGSGTTFSVGADMEGGNLSRPAGEEPDSAEFTNLVDWPQTTDKPVIAALNGDAVGGGITFSMLCDIRIVAEDAKIGFVFTRRGITAEMTAHWSLPRAVGYAVAQDLLLTGRVFRGTEAVEMGVCHRAVPASDVLAQARALAVDIATNCAPTSLAITKRLLWEEFNRTFQESSRREVALLQWGADEGDGPEGVRSFLERRPPQWRLPASAVPTHLL